MDLLGVLSVGATAPCLASPIIAIKLVFMIFEECNHCQATSFLENCRQSMCQSNCTLHHFSISSTTTFNLHINPSCLKFQKRLHLCTPPKRRKGPSFQDFERRFRGKTVAPWFTYIIIFDEYIRNCTIKKMRDKTEKK